MLIVHATKKLATRVGGFTPVPPEAADVGALGVWYANVVFWKPQVVVAVSETTLLPVLLPFAPATTLWDRFPAAVAEVMTDQGTPRTFIDDELSLLTASCCVSTNDRSLLGVLNEYIFLAEHAHNTGYGATNLPGLAAWLAQVPMSPLAKRHGSADRELAALST